MSADRAGPPAPHAEETDMGTPLSEAVRVRRERHARRQREGEGSLAQSLGMIGVLGWTIVAPMLAGIFAGRWLDHRLRSGIVWTGGLMTLGLLAGCVLAWRRVRE